MTFKQALANARSDVSPLCEVYSFGRKQWQFFWTSRRGREQSTPTSYAAARRARSARIADFAAEALAEARGLPDPSDAGSYAEHLVYNEGETIERAVRRTMNYSA
jgi:hypothetical protein